MKKKLFALAALVAALGSTAGTASAQDVLTGDTRLACEAILCLSSGTRPSECTPSRTDATGCCVFRRRWPKSRHSP